MRTAAEWNPELELIRAFGGQRVELDRATLEAIWGGKPAPPPAPPREEFRPVAPVDRDDRPRMARGITAEGVAHIAAVEEDPLRRRTLIAYARWRQSDGELIQCILENDRDYVVARSSILTSVGSMIEFDGELDWRTAATQRFLVIYVNFAMEYPNDRGAHPPEVGLTGQLIGIAGDVARVRHDSNQIFLCRIRRSLLSLLPPNVGKTVYVKGHLRISRTRISQGVYDPERIRSSLWLDDALMIPGSL